jgi:hypothetical protein
MTALLSPSVSEKMLSDTETDASSSYMACYGQKLIDGGFRPIPIAPREKKPSRVDNRGDWINLGWERFKTEPITPSHIRMWGSWSECGIGIICGDVVAVDIDLNDEAQCDLAYGIFNRMLGPTPAVRIGRPPRRLLVYRTETPFKKISASPIEVLADGQQFVAYGIHPEGHEYRWVSERLHELTMAELPLVTEAQVRLAVQAVLEALPEEATKGVRLALEPRELSPGATGAATSSYGQRGTMEAVAEALQFIPNNDNVRWDDWNRTGMAIFGAVGPSGYDLFEAWSMKSAKCGLTKSETPMARWAAYMRSPPTEIGAGTLYRMAQEHDWVPSPGLDLHPKPDLSHVDISAFLTPRENQVTPSHAMEVTLSLPHGVFLDGSGPASPPEWLIKGLMPKRGVCCLGGQSGAGKTFVAIDMAVKLATGEPFFGRRTRERIGVLILAGEGMATLQDRIRVAKADITSDDLPIAYAAPPIAIRNEKDADQVIETSQRVANCLKAMFDVRLGLVIFDTLVATFDVPDENDNAAAARCVRLMNRIENGLEAALLIVHHYGKAAETGLRGASAWRAGFDTVLSVQCNRNELTGATSGHSLALTKSRTTEEGPVSGFELERVELGRDEDDEPYSSCIVVPTGSAERARGARLTEGERLLGDIIAKETLLERVTLNGTTVWAVRQDTARREFFATSLYDGEGDKRDAALRKRFSRALKALIGRGTLANWTEEGETYIWAIPNIAPLSERDASSSRDIRDTP